jgi:hypothetical protein
MKTVAILALAEDRDGGAFYFAHVLRRRPTGSSSPFTSLRRTPHHPDSVALLQCGRRNAKAFPARDGRYPDPVGKGGGAGEACDGGHGRSRMPVVPGAHGGT